MLVHIEPWFCASDYERLRRLVPDYPHWAVSFDAWLDSARKRIKEKEAQGLTVAQPVDADEFVVWCGASGQKFGTHALRAFASAKARDLGVTPRLPFVCQGCGLRAFAILSSRSDRSRIELDGDFGTLCRTTPQRGEPWACLEFRSAVKQLRHVLADQLGESDYLPT